MIELIARKEGPGKLLAEGSARASREIGRGAEEFAMHVKGQEIPMHMPRCKAGTGFGYTISPTGADHCHNIHDHVYARQVGGAVGEMGVLEPLPPQDLSPGKVRMVHYGSLWQHALNCLVYCQFVPLATDKMVDLIRGITGRNTNLWELIKVAERCITMERAFNVREGKTRADDSLPKRFFTPFTSGPLAGVSLDPEKLKKAVDTYYGMAGWDANGVPTLAKLQELGIEWAAGVGG